jgi:hypothetical protein
MNVVVFVTTKSTKYSSLMLDDWLNNSDVEVELYSAFVKFGINSMRL